MRSLSLVLALGLLLPAPALRAQAADSSRRAPSDSTAAPADAADNGSLPRDVAREVIEALNGAATLRVTGSLEVAREREVVGDVAVLNGPVTIAGRVTGRVVAANADVVLEPGARVDGDVLVVGGIIQGRHEASVGGEVRVFKQPLYYQEVGDLIVAARSGDEEASWWQRWQRARRRSWSDLTVSSGHTYNRVEGLPIYVGPSLRRELGWGRASVEALGIFRTADHFHWDADNLGHVVRAELRLGDERGVVVGGRTYDVVDAVEDWHLGDAEVGLAAFFLHRDYRDYFNRHGGSAYVSLFGRGDADLTLAYSDERWGARAERDPFTLFRNTQLWPANPFLDEGRFHLLNATLRVDTRNDVDNPWSGWYLVGDFERGTGGVTAFTLGGPGAVTVPASAVRVTYNRGFLDLRRYNRLAPNAQLNLRAVLGGRLGGDPLPLERRFSVGGPGSLPGFDYRQPVGGADVGYCAESPDALRAGAPAACERVALAQAEYRGDLRINAFGELLDSRLLGRYGWHAAAQWVLFADAGRGWLVGPREGDLRYEKNDFPPPRTFRTDVGIGLDFGALGLYVAKAVSAAKQPANFVVRVRRRL